MATIHQVRIVGSGVDVTAYLGASSPKPSDGLGGWTQLDRKKRVGMSHWPGSNPVKQDVPIILDHYIDEHSVQPELDQLITLGRGHGVNVQPPTFTIQGFLQFAGTTWVMENLEFGEAEWEDGVLLRQELNLHVAEYVPGDILRMGSGTAAQAAAAGQSSFGIKLGGYIVKAGDTLYSIAVKVYNDKSRWQAIADLNKIRDPKNLKVGSLIFLP